MMHRLLGPALVLSLAASASVLSCGSSDSTSPTSEDAGSGGSAGTGGAGGNGGMTADAAGSTGGGGGTTATPDDGPNHCNGVTLAAGATCPTRMLASLTVIGPTYSVMGSNIVYGSGADLWNVYTLAGPGQARPNVVPGASALTVSATLSGAAGAQGWVAVGASLDGTNCIEESGYARGVIFNLSGDLGGCLLYLDLVDSQDESSAQDPCRGACSPGPTCVPPTVSITEMGMQTIPNMSFSEGGAGPGPNSSKIIGWRWRLLTPSPTMGCSANITLGAVQILGL